jgi:hypothetical protein
MPEEQQVSSDLTERIGKLRLRGRDAARDRLSRLQYRRNWS